MSGPDDRSINGFPADKVEFVRAMLRIKQSMPTEYDRLIQRLRSDLESKTRSCQTRSDTTVIYRSQGGVAALESLINDIEDARTYLEKVDKPAAQGPIGGL